MNAAVTSSSTVTETMRRGSHVRRFGVVYAVALAWVLAAFVFPSTPVEEVAIAADSGDFSPGGELAGGDVGSGGPATGGPGVGSAAPGATGGPAVTTGGAGATPGSSPAAGGGTTGPTGAGGAAGPAGGDPGAGPIGTTRGGVECAPGVRQVALNSYAAPCVPAWSGDNGGATFRGVTPETIRIVRRGFPESANSQAVDAVVAQAGGADPATVRAVRDVFDAHFAQQYELYGRRIEWVDYESEFGDSTLETQGRGREGACLDAEVVAEELQAFAVIGKSGAVSKPFAECAAQRGVVVLNGASYASETFYRSYHPYIWAIIMECERINYQVYEYFAKRLAGKPAVFAGDPALHGRERAFGTYTPVPDGGDTACADIGDREAARYGFEDAVASVYLYTLDVSRFPDEAARGIIQFKRDGVTSIVLACDAISAIFLTQSATSQNYRPEWLVIGVALTDIDNAARLYDQSQVDGHMFGMSQLGSTPSLLGPTGEPGILYQAITGRQIPAGTSGQFHDMTHVYNFLQMAGPNLTPEAIAAGAMTYPESGGPRYSLGLWNYTEGPDGTPGAGDHAAVDDSREVYWVGNVRSPADGEAGAFVETYGGKRFRNGEWPAEDPPVYPGR